MPNFELVHLSQSDSALTDGMGGKIHLYDEPVSHEDERHAMSLKVPASKVVACSPIQLVCALRLEKEFDGVLDRFVGILNAPKAHLVLLELVARFRSGKLRDVREHGRAEVAQSSPHTSLIYPKDDPRLVNIMERFKLTHVVLDDWYESSYHDRVRWIEFIGQFFGIGGKPTLS